MTVKVPRGIRCNNPGNIKKSPGDKTQRLGKRAIDDDPVFEEFDTAVQGIRALTRIPLNYHRRHGLKMVAAIIGRWAPPSENKTQCDIGLRRRSHIPPPV